MKALINLTKSLVKIQFIIILLFLGPKKSLSQNASEDLDNIPLAAGAIDCSGFGDGALGDPTLVGSDNSALGKDALLGDVNGNRNTAVGKEALLVNDGDDNTAVGMQALTANSSGNKNTAAGVQALSANTSGDENTALGYQSLISNTTEDNNTALGNLADVNATYTNQTSIGYLAVPFLTQDDIVSFGNASVGSIVCNVGYTQASDKRFKENIDYNGVRGLEFIMRLRPVVYNMDTKEQTRFITKRMPPKRQELYLRQDFRPSSSVRRSGFLAQEVEKAARECNYDFDGVAVPLDVENGCYALSYGSFVVPLVKAMQEQELMINDLLEEIKSSNIALTKLMSHKDNETSLQNLVINENSFRMEVNRPNPFSKETIIDYFLPTDINSASLLVSDLSGKQLKVYTVADRGSASITISSENLRPGIYLYSMLGDGKMLGSKRMMISGQ